MNENTTGRRDFIKGSLSVGLAASAAPMAYGGRANEQIRVGVIGCGGRGTYIAGQVNRVAKARDAIITAVCDVWKPQRERLAGRVEKWCGKRPKEFVRHTDLLQSGLVDAVIITTPDFAHCPVLIDSVNAGKHAYCEKPLSRSFDELVAARNAVRKSGCVVQIGTQRRSDGRFLGAGRVLKEGALGTISEIETAWHDCKPRWARDFSKVKEKEVDWEHFLLGQSDRSFDAKRFRCWHLYRDYSNGTPGLLGSHLVDAALMMVGDALPSSAVAHGGVYAWKDGRENCDTIECLWEYPSGFLMKFACRLGNNFSVPEVRVLGTGGSFDTSSWTLSPKGGNKKLRMKEELKTPKEGGTNHVDNWLDCVRSGKTPNASIEHGFSHGLAAVMASEAQRLGKMVRYDAEREALV